MRGSSRSVLRDYARGAVATLAIAASLLVSSPASAYSGIPMQLFALWPPYYCAQGSGTWVYASGSGGSTRVDIAARTYSMRGPGGCDYSSNAGTNVIAAWAKLERNIGGTWVLCAMASWEGNSAGTWWVESRETDVLVGCGSGTYRLRSENRITYGGNNYTSPPFTSSSVAI